MNPGQLGKIKSLVQTSPILNPQERGEWLALMEVMDDKQLFELEKILSSGISDKVTGISKAPSVQAPKPFEPQKVAPTPRPSPVPTPPQMGIPPLTHILNLPKEFTSQAPQSLPSKPVPAVEPKQAGITNLPNIRPPIRPVEQTKPSGFLTRLKSILKEKELPAPHSVAPPELKASNQQTAASNQQFGLRNQKPPVRNDLLVAKPGGEIGPGKLAAKGPPPVPRPPKAKLPSPQPSPKPVIVPQRPILPQQPPPPSKATPLIAPSLNRPSSITSKPPSPPAALNPYQPGLKSWSKLADSAERRKEELLKGHKPPLTTEKSTVLNPLPKQAPQMSGLREPVLQNLENLASLTSKQLKTYSASQFISKTKELMNNYGYHSVMFNLEKSPLYQAYLETGTRLLKDNSAFENLAESTASGHLGEKRYLTKDEFEDFTDLLMEIQAS